MSSIDELVKSNGEYAASFRRGDLPSTPARAVAVVTCMDSRLMPSRFLGLAEGDAHVIRNAGGSARDALRSLVISQRLLGTREVAIVKHTECGMLTFTNADLYEKVRQELGADASEIDFLPISSLEEAVRDDIRFLASSPLIAKDTVARGFIYDVKTGHMSEVA
jgi:carbonic anhydrase